MQANHQHYVIHVPIALLQRLRGHVTSLKASRDKLLLEVDKQSLEIERLLVENTALEQVMALYIRTLCCHSAVKHQTLSLVRYHIQFYGFIKMFCAGCLVCRM